MRRCGFIGSIGRTEGCIARSVHDLPANHPKALVVSGQMFLRTYLQIHNDFSIDAHHEYILNIITRGRTRQAQVDLFLCLSNHNQSLK